MLIVTLCITLVVFKSQVLLSKKVYFTLGFRLKILDYDLSKVLQVQAKQKE